MINRKNLKIFNKNKNRNKENQLGKFQNKIQRNYQLEKFLIKERQMILLLKKNKSLNNTNQTKSHNKNPIFSADFKR